MKPGRRALSRTLSTFVATIAFSAFVLWLHSAETPRPEDPQKASPVPCRPLLDSLLARAAEYCDGLDRSVLNFVCRERIEEWTRSSIRRFGSAFIGPRERHRYLYDYQLVRDPVGFYEERRTLLQDDGKQVSIPGSPLKTQSFSHAKVIEGPLGLLRREIQADHDYKVVGEERTLGQEAVVIEAAPKAGELQGQLCGRIWLRKSDAGILRIEWTPASIGHYEIIEEQARRLGMTPACVFTSEYAFEKNGVRFPSRYVAKEIYRRPNSGGSVQLAQVDVVYNEYRFFTVETKVDIRGGSKQP